MIMKTDNNNTPKGIRWSYREVLGGKSEAIMAFEIVFVAILLLVLFVSSKGMTKVGALFTSVLADLLSLKANAFALDMCATIAVIVPVMIVAWFAIAAVLTIVLNVRDRNLPRTPQNLEAHRALTQRGWAWPWSFLIGIFDFSALFVLVDTAFLALGGGSLSTGTQNLFTIVLTTVCLVFAERRIMRISCARAAKLEGNRAVVADVLDGTLDDQFPEKYHNDLGRAKIATIVAKGISRSPWIASLVVRGLDVRSKVLVFSGFLTATIHGFLTALSFGIGNTATISVILVNGQFGAGHGEEYMQSLREPEAKKTYFIVEVIAVIVCIVATFVTDYGYLLSS